VEQLTARLAFIASALIIILLFTAVTESFASEDFVGKVTEQTGPTEIQRDKNSIPSEVNSTVQMNDAVVTAKSKTRIIFKDDSLVDITEQSKLVIDNFVYDDSKTDAAKMGLKVALGTARFASGQIAKHTPESIGIETPTATVAVRGTDFTLTVDEMGRTLAVLLPSCPAGYKDLEKDCIVGQIDVKTDAGAVVLNKAFQSTKVSSREQKPTKPVILALNSDQINNLLIVSPPHEDKSASNKQSQQENQNPLAINFLDQNLLKFDGLDINFLTADQTKLSINYLDTDFLFNMLSLANSELLSNELSPENTMLPKYPPNKAAGLRYLVNDQSLTLYRTGTSSYAEITLDKSSNTTLSLNQDGTSVKQNVNGGNTSTIIIKQDK
jgi:FecR protein